MSHETWKKYLEEMKVLDKKTFSVEEIAKKHKVSVDSIIQQLIIGIKVEKEHTTDENAAKEIALDHLLELPDYYSRLKKMEK